MSLTSADQLRSALVSGNVEAVVELLESREDSGLASALERVALGILLMMPPFADYENAGVVFRRGLTGARRFEAAVWEAYRYLMLLPSGSNEFSAILDQERYSPVAAYMRAYIAEHRGDMELAIHENSLSLELRSFPFNIIQGLRLNGWESSEKHRFMLNGFSDLTISRTAESDPPIETLEGLVQRHWENLILGTRLTSQAWQDYKSKYGVC